MRKPTLMSLAEQLGVSRQTVSNVINNPERVKASTRERVQRAIEETGYRPSASARALRSQRAMQLAFRLRDSGDGINGTVLDTFLHGLVSHADRHGYRISLLTATTDEHEVEQLHDLHESRAIDGCILTHTTPGDRRPEALTELRVPFVCFGRPWDDPDATHSWIDVDGAAGTLAAVEQLRSIGCRRVGYIGWPDRIGTGAERRKGWAASCGLDDEERTALQYAAQDGIAEGAAGARHLLAQGADGIVCASDSLAIGALSHCRSVERVVPIVGFDDTPVARALGLSSLRQPMEDLAQAAIESLLVRLRDREAEHRHIVLPPELVQRNTPASL